MGCQMLTARLQGKWKTDYIRSDVEVQHCNVWTDRARHIRREESSVLLYEYPIVEHQLRHLSERHSTIMTSRYFTISG